ncbi:hypothetical protein EVAR_21899_1 [Eumeta japonica]|uniref:Uncharacterized protein n=1 Tax=Eumeta variegata TaxID=151549 RepID=A0A4C1XJS2_EUMVA|nr:hypothetical protein EVAR_21899_1 [Eumeta japonica]
MSFLCSFVSPVAYPILEISSLPKCPRGTVLDHPLPTVVCDPDQLYLREHYTNYIGIGPPDRREYKFPRKGGPVRVGRSLTTAFANAVTVSATGNLARSPRRETNGHKFLIKDSLHRFAGR